MERSCGAEDACLTQEYGENFPKPKRSYSFDQVFSIWYTVSLGRVDQFRFCLLHLVKYAINNENADDPVNWSFLK